MKKYIIPMFSISLLLSPLYTHTESTIQSNPQLAQTIEQAFFTPASGLNLTHEEMNVFTNLIFFEYMHLHHVLRSHISTLNEQAQHRKEILEKTYTACLNYINSNGSASLKAAVNLLQENTKSIKKTYLNKYQEELISGERDTFVHAQVLQQVAINLLGMWYKALYEGMQKNNFEKNYYKIAFNIEGLVPVAARTGELPAPNLLM